jgi:hypothetical protein
MFIGRMALCIDVEKRAVYSMYDWTSRAVRVEIHVTHTKYYWQKTSQFKASCN